MFLFFSQKEIIIFIFDYFKKLFIIGWNWIVWVIRVYLICSLLTPIVFYFNDKIESCKMKFLILLAIYALYEVLVLFGINDSSMIFNFIIAYAIPYGIIYVLGMVSKKTSPNDDLKISIIFFMISIVFS